MSPQAELEIEELIERTKEFQLLRVTKDLQHMIRGGSEENQQVQLHVRGRYAVFSERVVVSSRRRLDTRVSVIILSHLIFLRFVHRSGGSVGAGAQARADAFDARRSRRRPQAADEQGDQAGG